MTNLHEFVLQEKQRIAKICEENRNNNKGVIPTNKGRKYATREKIAEMKAARDNSQYIVLHKAK